MDDHNNEPSRRTAVGGNAKQPPGTAAAGQEMTAITQLLAQLATQQIPGSSNAGWNACLASVPQYTGKGDPSDHVRDVEYHATIQGVKDSEKKKFLLMNSMVGDALVWHQGTKHIALQETYDQFVARFLKEYHTADRQLVTEEQLMRHTQALDQTLQNHIHYVQDLCRKIDPKMSEAQKIIKCLHGMNPKLKIKLREKGVLHSWDEFYTEAKNLDTIYYTASKDKGKDAVIQVNSIAADDPSARIQDKISGSGVWYAANESLMQDALKAYKITGHDSHKQLAILNPAADFERQTYLTLKAKYEPTSTTKAEVNMVQSNPRGGGHGRGRPWERRGGNRDTRDQAPPRGGGGGYRGGRGGNNYSNAHQNFAAPSDDRCYRCYARGHAARDCTSDLSKERTKQRIATFGNQQQSQVQAISCYECTGPHHARNCPNKQNNNNSNQNYNNNNNYQNNSNNSNQRFNNRGRGGNRRGFNNRSNNQGGYNNNQGYNNQNNGGYQNNYNNNQNNSQNNQSYNQNYNRQQGNNQNYQQNQNNNQNSHYRQVNAVLLDNQTYQEDHGNQNQQLPIAFFQPPRQQAIGYGPDPTQGNGP